MSPSNTMVHHFIASLRDFNNNHNFFPTNSRSGCVRNEKLPDESYSSLKTIFQALTFLFLLNPCGVCTLKRFANKFSIKINM